MEAAALPLRLLSPSRREILVLLKREGPLAAGAVAARTDVSVSGARQALSSLEKEGLVTHRRDRQGPGRPRHLYELTRDGHQLFPRRYAELSTELLGYLEELDEDLLEKVFARRRHRRLEEARSRLEGRSFPEKVRELARILDEDGYLAEARELGNERFRIVEHNCAVRRIAERYGHACSSEIGFLRDALPDAEIVRVSHIASGEPACAYEIRRIDHPTTEEE